MNTNQAFDILSKAGGISAARIIINSRNDHKKPISRFWVWQSARKLRRGIPVAKIINEKWFYGLRFYTNKNTLDPRPDTETLVEAVLSENKKPIKILDIGTGTGCLIISIIKNIKNSTGVGIDKSFGACHVARKNVHIHNLESQIKIKCANFKTFETDYLFDVIVSNPPYIPNNDPRVDRGALHDPHMSLYAGDDGLDAYRIIASRVKQWLRPGGKIYLEIGIGQETEVQNIFENNGLKFIVGIKDLGGVIRVLGFEN